jgi:Phage gp6-like head-tail connector protein
VPRLSLDTVKAHLRVTVVDASQDALISIYTDAAEEFAELYCRKSFGNELPSPVKAAALLMVGDLFNSREGTIIGTIVDENPTVKNLLNKFRDLSDFFGPSVNPAMLVPFDSESIFLGEDFSRVWRYSDESGPINITGYLGTFELYSGSSVISTGPLVIDSALGGEFSYTLSGTFTSTLSAEAYWYKVQCVAANGSRVVLDRKQLQFL